MSGTRPWVVIAAPAWPSPYFAELRAHAPAALRLEFAADPDALTHRPESEAGTVNLHRLKRLYRDGDGRRTRAGARAMLDRLRDLRARGWRVVWTVHNLLPIDGGTPNQADRDAAHGVLALADAVVTHTRADAATLSGLTRAPITVAGWAGLSAGPDNRVPAHVARLARDMRAVPWSALVLGNLTAYKDPPALVRAFTTHTRAGHLFVVGPPRDAGDLADLAHPRVHVLAERVAPGCVHALYRAADVAVCPYRVDGDWEFFTRVLHPASVATAVAFGTPVIAPDLPAIREITHSRPHVLHTPAAGPGPALAAFEHRPHPAGPRPRVDGAGRWRAITTTYLDLSQTLHPRPPV